MNFEVTNFEERIAKFEICAIYSLLSGMNIYGLSVLYEAAQALGIPEWIVDVRHDATHGQMPSLYMLR